MSLRIISPTTDAIQRRFFAIVEKLIVTGRMKSLSAFCDEHHLHRPKYSRLRTLYATGETTGRYKTIDIDALAFLAADYRVSLSWLMFGTGKEFK